MVNPLKAAVNKVAPDLFLFTLSPPIDGFSGFIGAWLYRGEIAFLVDVGPSSTAAELLKALQELNVAHLDYIFLTHIHLDHAGGIGEIASAYPQTPIICHPDAISHLMDPSALWKATQKVLGSTASAYGPIQPIPGRRLVNAAQFKSDAVIAIMTPGHAAHHISLLAKKYLFAGEAGGVFYSLSPGRFYLRPATPPRFFFEVALNSIDKLIACSPAVICYGHYGLQDNALEMLKIHRNQLFVWKEVIKKEIENSKAEDLVATCLESLFEKDPLLAGFQNLPRSARKREKYFLQNSIKGFIGYLKGI
jgi:glyoxylase-like metal-dependent hydrolase (beta-lactamase superfamily II)